MTIKHEFGLEFFNNKHLVIKFACVSDKNVYKYTLYNFCVDKNCLVLCKFDNPKRSIKGLDASYNLAELNIKLNKSWECVEIYEYGYDIETIFKKEFKI